MTFPVTSLLQLRPITRRARLLTAVSEALGRRGVLFVVGPRLRRFFLLPGDYVSDTTLIQGSYEKEVIDALRHLILILGYRGATFLDIGSHFGLYCVELKRDCANFLAVEPNPVLAHVIRANLLWSSISGEVIECAMAGARGKLDLCVNESGNLGSSSLIGGDVTNTRRYSVDVRTVDDLLAQVAGRIAIQSLVLKIDVEGLEIDVLAGAKHTIEQYRPLIQVEIGPDASSRFVAELPKLARGYELLALERDNPTLLEERRSALHLLRWIRNAVKLVINRPPKLWTIRELPPNTYLKAAFLIPTERVSHTSRFTEDLH